VVRELNHLLADISSHTDSALAQMPPDAALRPHLEAIQKSSQRAAGLTRQLLAFARQQAIDPGQLQGSETILLADDAPSLRQLVAEMLQAQGYTVLEAADGNEALELAKAHAAKIRLLVTDVIMPGLNGKMLAEWLSRTNPAIRILFISGHINNNAVRDAMLLPGTHFLRKPFNPLDLARKVREILDLP